MSDYLEWQNLLDNSCPKCDEALIMGILEHWCSECGFHIKKQRAQEIIDDIREKEQEDEIDDSGYPFDD